MAKSHNAEDIKETFAADGSATGVEVSEDGLIDHPFDPADIDIQTTPIPLSKALSRIEHGEIRLDPDFQRGENLWGMRQKSQLIESLMLGIPLPMFYVAADINGNWTVVDGIQRFGALRDYIIGENYINKLSKFNKRDAALYGNGFILSELEFLQQFEEKTFRELPRKQQRDIEETIIQVTVIRPGTPDAVKFNIFKRINTGGLPLSAQEIRHALHQGVATSLLKELVATPEYKKATGGKVKDSRMAGRELVLRMISFLLREPKDYKRKDIDGFLNDTMRILNHIGGTPESSNLLLPEYCKVSIDELRKQFKQGMKRAHLLFKTYAFRKSLPGFYRTPINKALFETWGAELARLPDKKWDNVLSRKDELHASYEKLMGDTHFWNAVSYSSSDPQKLQLRFKEVRKLIGKFSM